MSATPVFLFSRKVKEREPGIDVAFSESVVLVMAVFRYMDSATDEYTCQLSRLRGESHACWLKTSMSRRLTLAGLFLRPDWKMSVVDVLLDTISKNMLTQTHVRNENHAPVSQKKLAGIRNQYVCYKRVQMYTMCCSRKAKNAVKLPTIISVVFVIIGVKQRGIRIIIRRGMVMLTFFSHTEEKTKCAQHDLSHAVKNTTNQAAREYLSIARLFALEIV